MFNMFSSFQRLLHDFIPKQVGDYCKSQAKIAEPRAWKEGVPLFFRNRPTGFITHLQQRMDEAEKTILPEMVEVQFKNQSLRKGRKKRSKRPNFHFVLHFRHLTTASFWWRLPVGKTCVTRSDSSLRFRHALVLIGKKLGFLANISLLPSSTPGLTGMISRHHLQSTPCLLQIAGFSTRFLLVLQCLKMSCWLKSPWR